MDLDLIARRERLSGSARYTPAFMLPSSLRDRDWSHLDLGHPLGFRYADLPRGRGREIQDAIFCIRPAVLDGDDRALPGLEIGYFRGGTERQRPTRRIGALWVHSGA